MTPSQDQSYRSIPLGKGLYALVDAEDFDYLNQWAWHPRWNPGTRSYYAMRNNSRSKRQEGHWIWMHREILGLKYGDERQGEHGLCDTLDNRKRVDGKENLRIATCAENQHNQRIRQDNSTGFKGIDYIKNRSTYRARIMVNGKSVFLGVRKNIEDAVELRRKASEDLHGRFARQA